MGKEDYVSIEVAKLLKGKGYPQEYNVGTLCRLQNKANKYYEKTREITQSDIDNAWCIFNEVYPTLYEAQKWLREKHNIHLDVRCVGYSRPLRRADYRCEVFAVDNREYSESKIYHRYEDSLNEGILKALEMI